MGSSLPTQRGVNCKSIAPGNNGRGRRADTATEVQCYFPLLFGLFVDDMATEFGFTPVFQRGTDDLLDEHVFAIELNFSVDG